MLKELSDLMRPSKTIYKVDMFWSQWTKQVETRIVRDALGIQRLARVSGADYLIGCDEVAHSILMAMGIQVTLDFLEPTAVLLYLTSEDVPEDLQARIPDCESVDTVIIQAPKVEEQFVDPVDLDPYGGVKLFVDWQRIPETMPLEKAPPKGPSDPSLSPWM